MATAAQPAATVARTIARLHIDDVHCWECADLLELAIESYPGVESAPVGLDGWCDVSFGPGAVAVEDLIHAIDGCGHHAELRGTYTNDEQHTATKEART